MSNNRFYTGFEYAKRQFRKTYGAELPIWALFASGSCGGVRILHNVLTMHIYTFSSFVSDLVLAGLLSSWYAMMHFWAK